MQNPTARHLVLPRTYFESMVEADILVVYRGRMYTPIVAPSPEQAAQYSAASIRLSSMEFVLEPLEKLTVLEDRYLNGRAMHAALQQYQQDYLTSIGNAAISADLQEEMLETALLRFITDEVFPSFATSERTLGRLLDRKFAQATGVEPEVVHAREEHHRRRQRGGWDDGSYDFHSNQSRNQNPPAETSNNRAHTQTGNTQFLRALLNNDAEQVQGSVAQQIQPPTPPSRPAPETPPSSPTLAAAHARIDRELGQAPPPSATDAAPPTMQQQPSLERNFSRLLRYSTTTREVPEPPPPPAPASPAPTVALATQNVNPGVTVALPAAANTPTAPQQSSVQPSNGQSRSNGNSERLSQSQRGLTQPRLVAPPAQPVRQFSMVEQLLGLTNFAVIEGIVYTLQPARGGERADVRMGNHEFSLRPYMLLTDLLNHYSNSIGEMLRNEAKSNQPAVQQLRQDRRYVEEKLQRNYGAAGLSLERINARSYFVCLSINPFANRGSDGKFYVFSGALLKEMARRAGMDTHTVRDPLKVAIQLTINWSQRGFEKITAGEPIMLGPAKGPFITWARELTYHEGFVIDRDVCTDNYQPPANLSFGAGIANKLETSRRIIQSGYILGAVRPRSLLTADGYAGFQVTPEWLREHNIPVTNVAG